MNTNFIWFIFGTIFMTQLSAASFGYGKHQQHIWPRKFKECNGKMQSPIALSTSKSIVMPLPALEMIGFHDFLSDPLTLKNNGHSVTLNIQKNHTHRYPYVFGATLNENEKYVLEGLHFHWGIKNNRGSEHTLNDVRYSMEMHIIHKKIVYSNLEDALKHDDGLAVLGIFFQVQDVDNTNLNEILKYLPTIKWVGTEVKLNTTFITLNSFMPKDTDTFYTYRGSLTTPPCSEAVTWIIFSTPVPISFRQMAKFRLLSNGKETLADNYRKLQNIGRRKVYMRKLIPKYLKNMNFFKFNMTNLIWFWQ